MMTLFILIACAIAMALVLGVANVTRDGVPTRGGKILYTNTGSAIVAGDVIILRSGTSGICGVAAVDIAATTGTGTIYTGEGDEKVFKTTAKATGEVWAIGTILYYDGTSITSTSSTTFTRIGTAAAAAVSADTTGYFILNGM